MERRKREELRATSPQQDEEPTRRYFGAGLALMRDTFSERVVQNATPGLLVKARPTAKALVECLQGRGYSIGSATYSEIEGGLILPRDGTAFVEAVAVCLHLNETERRDLIERLAYDILFARLGAAAREVLLPRAEWDRG